MCDDKIGKGSSKEWQAGPFDQKINKRFLRDINQIGKGLPAA